MKKLLGIAVLGLLLCTPSYSHDEERFIFLNCKGDFPSGLSSIYNDELIKKLEEKLALVNSKAFNYLRVSTIVICKDEWTPQNEILTPTMKIKRGNVDKKYMDKYDGWHHSDKKIIWE